MTCPAGCLRLPGHFGFHTTVPAIAEREDDRERPFQDVTRAAALAYPTEQAFLDSPEGRFAMEIPANAFLTRPMQPNRALRQYNIFSPPNTVSLRGLFDQLQAEQAFPAPLKFGPDGDIWIAGPPTRN